MTGGGFGGSAIALVPAGQADVIAEAVTHAFADAGFTAPSTFVVHPVAVLGCWRLRRLSVWAARGFDTALRATCSTSRETRGQRRAVPQ